MVAKRSEYQRQFKVCALKKHLPSYYENLAFRNNCRDREYTHTPIEWESSDESEAGDILICSDKENDQTQESTDASKPNINNEDGHGKLNKCTSTENILSENDGDSSSDSDEDDDEKEVVVFVRRKKRPRKDPKLKVFTKKNRIKRPDRCQDIPKAPRKARLVSATDRGKPPFELYGWAERQKHQTHNVLSARDIYTNALKAKQKQLQQRKEEQERKECHRKQLKDLFDKHLALKRRGSPADWISEYKSGFPAYDSFEYARVISARAASSASRH